MRKIILSSSILFIPVIVLMTVLSCDNEIPKFEIVGQEIFILQEGIYSDVLINIDYTLNEITSNGLPISFTNFLYATSPAPPDIINLIENISIISSTDYHQNLPAGSELISIFGINLYPNTEDNMPFPIKIGENRGLFLYLKVAPDKDIVMTLEITTALDNGEIFTSESESFDIKN